MSSGPPSPSRAPSLRWLSGSDVEAAMPTLDERLELAERVLVALVDDAELPPKIGVHPRPEGSFGHAMPAFLHGSSLSGDRLGLKWVTGFPNQVSSGLAAIHAVVVLNDAATGMPVAMLDGGPITAHRTAAVSGVAIRRFGPAVSGRPARVALIGAGVQAHAHLPVLGAVLPGAHLALWSRTSDRTQALAQVARVTPGIVGVEVAGSARSAVAGADVVVTAASFGPIRQVMTNAWLAPSATVVPVDYATYCAAEVARDAALFLVDERRQFETNRAAGLFDGYPDPTATLGEVIRSGTPRPHGRLVAMHLGVGLADVLFADAILRRAEAAGLGTILPR